MARMRHPSTLRSTMPLSATTAQPATPSRAGHSEWPGRASSTLLNQAPDILAPQRYAKRSSRGFGESSGLRYSRHGRGLVRFTLDDGEALTVPDEGLRRIYDSLWEISQEPGAVSTAALVIDESPLSPYVSRPVALTAAQRAVFRKALEQPHV